MTDKRSGLSAAALLEMHRLTADLTASPEPSRLKRLRRVAAALAQRHPKRPLVEVEGLTGSALKRNLTIDAGEDELESLARELETEEAPEASEILDLRRLDRSSAPLAAHRLSGLAASERLGPFLAGIDEVWFDLFFRRKSRSVRQLGSPWPLLVLDEGGRPHTNDGATTVALGAGTLWVRGDLLSASLQQQSYVGFVARAGELRLEMPVSVDGDELVVDGPLQARLTIALEPAPDVPAGDGCRAAQATIELPSSITLTFSGASVQVSGGSGRATAWQQSFDFRVPTGSSTFIQRSWTLVLGYELSPDSFSLDPIVDELVQFSGKARIARGGLGFPVVEVSDADVLGDASRGPDWWLELRDFEARWYEPEPRSHAIEVAWLTISQRGTTILCEAVPALEPVVRHQIALWPTASGGGRTPWDHSYPTPFVLGHQCDVLDGESFFVGGEASLSMDRPVQTSGQPLAPLQGNGFLVYRRVGELINATLLCMGSAPPSVSQLALKNALVWVTSPLLVLVRGVAESSRSIADGQAHLVFGNYAWSPILPDPYVANVAIRAPRIGNQGHIRSLLLCQLGWAGSDPVQVRFSGAVAEFAGVRHPPSDGGSKPAAFDQSGNVGLTQEQQHALRLSERDLAVWQAAQKKETGGRQKRLEEAARQNESSQGTIGGVFTKTVPARPNVLLLDVSTNQDHWGVAIGAHRSSAASNNVAATSGEAGAFVVRDLEVHTSMRNMLVVSLPAVQWEPVRTLDSDQDIFTLGWFPTPLASANDGGATALGVASQTLAPVYPDGAIQGTSDAFDEGIPVGLRTTLPFGLVAAAIVNPHETSARRADLYQLTRPSFPGVDAIGGRQITAIAEGGRAAQGGISPMFQGAMRQLINGVELASGAPLGISVLGSTADPGGSVETVFNNDMAARPRVPVTRFDLSGYGASNFSRWENPFAAFAEAAKVQFRLMVGRTALEVIKVNSVLHPWGIRVTRSVTVERRPGGGVIRRDSGWQPITDGLFDYRYADDTGTLRVAPYEFDAGLFRGLFNVRAIRPAPGVEVSHGGATFIPYYFDADAAIDGASERSQALGMLGYLQTQPNGEPATVNALQALIESQGSIGGPVDRWIDVAGSGLRFRVRRMEVALAQGPSGPVFVATLRGVPGLPTTGAWSVVKRPIQGTPVEQREAFSVGEGRGVPLIRRYPIAYPTNDTPHQQPPLSGTPGAYRLADAADLFDPPEPAFEYALLQSTPTHALLFPRPYVHPGSGKLEFVGNVALADVFARATSKGAFPPPPNVIDGGSRHLNVAPGIGLGLSAPVQVVGYATPLRVAGEQGHGSQLYYDNATLYCHVEPDRWETQFTGLRMYHDVAGMQLLTGARMDIVGSTEQRSQIAEYETLMLPEIEEIMSYIPLFGQRGIQGPIDLAVTNAKHEFKVEAQIAVEIPPFSIPVAGTELKLKLISSGSTGFDKDTGELTATGKLGLELGGKIPLLSIGVASVFLTIKVGVNFTIVSISGVVSSEKLGLDSFVGLGIEGRLGPFKAYAFLGVGFILSYDITADLAKYGGLVAFEAGVEVIEDFPITKVKIRAELKGLVYTDGPDTKCDMTGSVKLQVDLFLIISISVSYEYSDTVTI